MYCDYCQSKKAVGICGDCQLAAYCSTQCQRKDYADHAQLCGARFSKKKKEEAEVCLTQQSFFQSFFELWQLVSERWTRESTVKKLGKAEQDNEMYWATRSLDVWNDLAAQDVPAAMEKLVRIEEKLSRIPLGDLQSKDVPFL